MFFKSGCLYTKWPLVFLQSCRVASTIQVPTINTKKKGKLAFRHEISYHQHEDKGLWGELVQVHIEDVNSPIQDSTISNEQVVEDKFFTPHGFISLATRTMSTLSWILGESLLKPKRAHIYTKMCQISWFKLIAYHLIFGLIIQAHKSHRGNFGSCGLKG